jgi:hypothetical protein
MTTTTIDYVILTRNPEIGMSDCGAWTEHDEGEKDAREFLKRLKGGRLYRRTRQSSGLGETETWEKIA